MRILQLCSTFRMGGIQRHALDLGAWLRGRGHYIAFAGTPGPWLDENSADNYLALDTVLVTQEGGNAIARLVTAVRCGLKLRRYLKSHQIQLVHAHESAPAFVARIATFGLNIPVIVTYHGSEPWRVGQFGRIARFSAQLVITPSYRSAKDLEERGGVPASKLKVIGLGVKPTPAIDEDRVRQLRANLLGPDGQMLVVMIARIDPQKGIDVLVEVVRDAVANSPGLRFVVVGTGPQKDEVEGWAENAGVADYLSFVGQSDEAHHYLRAGDLFLLTSRWEALPITIVEAFRAGLPVVATNCSGVVELVDESVGRVVAVEDVGAIKAAVLEICDNDDLRRELAVNAIKRSSEDRFLPAHINQIFERTYAEILGETLPLEADNEDG